MKAEEVVIFYHICSDTYCNYILRNMQGSWQSYKSIQNTIRESCACYKASNVTVQVYIALSK
jgi:hypothetical protein